MKPYRTEINQPLINLVHFYDKPGGLEILIPPVILALNKKKFRSFVIRPHSGDIPSVYKGLNIPVSYGSVNNLVAAFRLFLYARKKRKEIFHVFNVGPLFLLILRLAGVKKLIYSIHGTIYWQNKIGKIVSRIFWPLAIDRKNYIFTSNSGFSSKMFNKRISVRVGCQLLYNFVDTERFDKNNRRTNEKTLKKIIYAGRLSGSKGLERWIDAASVIHEKYPEVIFEIYGEGVLRSLLLKRINNNNATGYIFLKGHNSNIGEVYINADILLFLTQYESFGNVVVESLICGTPVLTTPVPSLKEILADFPVFLLDSLQPSHEEILTRLNNIDILKDQAEKASGILKERFSMRRHTEKLEKIYDSF